MGSKLRVILGLFGFLGLALGALLLLRAQIAEFAAKRYMAAYGLSNASIEVNSIGVQSSTVSLAALVDTSNLQIDVKLPQVVISYAFSDLIRKSLEAIQIDRGQICLHFKESNSETKTANSDSFDIPKLLRTLPVSKVDIHAVVACLEGVPEFPANFSMEKGGGSPEPVYNLELAVEKGSAQALNQAFFMPDWLKFESGSFEAKIKSSNREGVQETSAAVVARDLNGTVDDVTFHGFNSNASFNKLSPVTMPEFSHFSIANLLYGLEFKDLAGNYRIKNSEIEIKNIKGQTFGGEIFLEQGRLPFKNSNWKVEIRLKNIDLEKVLELYPQERITATGRVDVTLPLSHDTKGFRVVQGGLVATEGGTIRVAHLEAGTQLTETLNLLSDFQYSSLKAEVDYEPQGDLALRLHLSGKNENWYSGHPINLNVNVSENVPALIQSIRLATGQAQELEDIVRQSKGR